MMDDSDRYEFEVMQELWWIEEDLDPWCLPPYNNQPPWWIQQDLDQRWIQEQMERSNESRHT